MMGKKCGSGGSRFNFGLLFVFTVTAQSPVKLETLVTVTIPMPSGKTNALASKSSVKRSLRQIKGRRLKL